MSGSSYTYFTPLKNCQLRYLLEQLPDDAIIQVPSINREPGKFISADHVFFDSRENTISLDGDISEAHKGDQT